MVSWLKKLWEVTLALGYFVRFPALGGTLILLILGAGATLSPISPIQVLILIAIGIAFHIFAYVFNDIIDLPIDRSEPRRRDFPLVTGVIRPRLALVFALAQIPLAFTMATWLESSAASFYALAIAFVCMAIYDIWGKRFAFPPLTDAIQGLSWAALVLFGSTVNGQFPNSLAWLIAIYVTLFIIMTNGVHGSLRDLYNDLQCGVRSTAILLGARPQGIEGITITSALVRYTVSLQLSLIGILFAALFWNLFRYNRLDWVVTSVAVLILSALSLRLLLTAISAAARRQDMISAGMLHLVISLGSLIVLFALALETWISILLIVMYLAPLLTFGWFYNMLNWAFGFFRNKNLVDTGSNEE